MQTMQFNEILQILNFIIEKFKLYMANVSMQQ